jgi:hypothetical protein
MLLASTGAVAAPKVKVVASFQPEGGRIADAAIFGRGHIALLYSEAGRIADYTSDGRLQQHIVREAGIEALFRPTACFARGDGSLMVFDEVAHQVFNIASDGNIGSGVNLAYSEATGEAPLALARVGDLLDAGSGQLWAMLPDRGALARFSRSGDLLERQLLADDLPYQPAQLTRPQFDLSGTLYVLDYAQGSILYRRAGEKGFRRIKLTDAGELDAFPGIQDYAASPDGVLLAATYDPQKPLLVLAPDGQGYKAHPLKLKLPAGPNQIALRYSGGKYILWTRDATQVTLLELQ